MSVSDSASNLLLSEIQASPSNPITSEYMCSTETLWVSDDNLRADPSLFQVFEQYSELKPAVGAGFNINGGAVVLQRLGLAEDLKEIANPMKRVLARTVDGDVLFDVDVKSTMPDSLIDKDGEPVCYTVMRSDLQRVLEKRLPEGEKIFA